MTTTTFDRNAGLGASDASAACGQSKWETRLQLYREKTGLATPDELFAKRLPIRMGKALEPLVLDLFSEKSGLSSTAAQQQVVRDTVRPWRWVTLDALASDARPIEAKTAAMSAAFGWGDQNEDDSVPMPYYLQAQHCMACAPDGANWDYVWMPVLVLNREFRIYRVRRDNDVIELMTLQELAFWNNVLSRTPPPPTDPEDLALAYPTDRGTTLVATAELCGVITELAATKAALSIAKKRETELVTFVKAAIAEHSCIKDDAGNLLATCKQAKASEVFDVDAFRAAHPHLFAGFLKDKPGSRRLLLK